MTRRWPTVTKETFALHAGLTRVMARVTTRFLRPLGLVVICVDHQGARWLKQILSDLPDRGASDEPYSATLRAWARDFAEALQAEQNAHPAKWGASEAPRYP